MGDNLMSMLENENETWDWDPMSNNIRSDEESHTPNLNIIDSTIDHHNIDQIDIDMPSRDQELNDNDNIDLHNNQVSPRLNHDSSAGPSSEDHDPVLQALGLSIVERNATPLLPPRPRLQFPESEYQRYLESTGRWFFPRFMNQVAALQDIDDQTRALLTATYPSLVAVYSSKRNRSAAGSFLGTGFFCGDNVITASCILMNKRKHKPGKEGSRKLIRGVEIAISEEYARENVNICTTTNSYFGANEGGFSRFQWTQQVDEVDIDLKTGICVFPTTWSQYYPSLPLASSTTLHMPGDAGYFVSLDKDLSLMISVGKIGGSYLLDQAPPQGAQYVSTRVLSVGCPLIRPWDGNVCGICLGMVRNSVGDFRYFCPIWNLRRAIQIIISRQQVAHQQSHSNVQGAMHGLPSMFISIISHIYLFNLWVAF